MDLILNLLYGAVEAILWGIVFIFVAFVILPQSIINYVLKRLRPDLISKPDIVSKLKTILDYIFNNKNVVISSDNDCDISKKEEEFKELLKEKKSLENNLFFLDMLRNLTQMLYFSASRTGYSEDSIIEILRESMYYLSHYGRNIENTKGMQNQKERLSEKTTELEETLSSIIEFKENALPDSRDEIIAKVGLEDTIKRISESMEVEFKSTEEQLNKTNQILVQKFMNFLG